MDTFQGRNQDPISLHKYLYASANPVNKVDPSGKDILDSLFALSVQLSIIAFTIAPYLFTIALVAESVYIATSLLIAVDKGVSDKTHSDTLNTLREGSAYVFFITYSAGEATQTIGLIGGSKQKPGPVVKDIELPKSRYPDCYQHTFESQGTGRPSNCHC